MPKPRKTKLGYAVLASVPAAVVLGAVLKRKKQPVRRIDSAERERTIGREAK